MSAVETNGEPTVKYTVKQLLERIDKRLDGIEEKLDDRVTVAVFTALQQQVSALMNRLQALEASEDTRASKFKALLEAATVVARLAAWIVAVALGVLGLLKGGYHF